MRAPNVLGLLVTALSVSAVAEATLFDGIQGGLVKDILPRETSGAKAAADSIVSDLTNTDPSSSASSKAANSDSSTSASQDPVTSKSSSAATSKSPDPPSSTSAPTPTSDPASDSTSDPPTTGSTPTTGPQPTNTAAESTTQSDQGRESTTTSAPPRKSTFTSTITTVVVSTDAQGDVHSLTSVATTTGTATLAITTSGSDSGSSGLSTQSRNTIIGVVVGVGGAALLAGIGFVWWRLWNKNRKARQDEVEDLMGDAGKPEAGGMGVGQTPGGAQSPFTSNLDRYHQPTVANASANF